MTDSQSPETGSGMQPYSIWNIHITLSDAANQELESFAAVQHVYVGADGTMVRVTRDLHGTGSEVVHDDRGVVDAHGAIVGCTGFGGNLTDQFLRNGSILLQGSGGDADFIMGATRIAADHMSCFRRFEVNSPTMIFGVKVEAGVYFATSDDHLANSADDAPPELKAALAA